MSGADWRGFGGGKKEPLLAVTEGRNIFSGSGDLMEGVGRKHQVHEKRAEYETRCVHARVARLFFAKYG